MFLSSTIALASRNVLLLPFLRTFHTTSSSAASQGDFLLVPLRDTDRHGQPARRLVRVVFLLSCCLVLCFVFCWRLSLTLFFFCCRFPLARSVVFYSYPWSLFIIVFKQCGCRAATRSGDDFCAKHRAYPLREYGYEWYEVFAYVEDAKGERHEIEVLCQKLELNGVSRCRSFSGVCSMADVWVENHMRGGVFLPGLHNRVASDKTFVELLFWFLLTGSALPLEDCCECP